jgi:cell division protein FtsW
VPYRLLSGRVAWYGLAGATVLLVLLLLPIGLAVVVRGTRRFLNLGVTQVQPAEFARFALVVFLASYASRKQEWFQESWRSLIVPLAVIGLLCGLIQMQPNLSSAALLGLLGLALLWLGGQPLRRLVLLVLPAIPVVLLSLRGYQMQRFLSFVSALLGGKDAELPYHLKQSLIAMGSGGFLGKGIGQGLQKYHYLPFPHTDSILGVVGEETGFLGVLVLFTVYGIVILRGLRIARLAPDLFPRLLALGLTLSMAMNVLLHSAVVLGVGPATGVPLPFVSHGGSSLLTNLTAMGILLSISRHVQPEPEALRRTWRWPGGLSRVH